MVLLFACVGQKIGEALRTARGNVSMQWLLWNPGWYGEDLHLLIPGWVCERRWGEGIP